MNSALNASAIRRASVVLPTPGGPHRIIECSLPDANATASGLPGASRWRWPITSSMVRRAQPLGERRTGMRGSGGGEEIGHGGDEDVRRTVMRRRVVPAAGGLDAGRRQGSRRGRRDGRCRVCILHALRPPAFTMPQSRMAPSTPFAPTRRPSPSARRRSRWSRASRRRWRRCATRTSATRSSRASGRSRARAGRFDVRVALAEDTTGGEPGQLFNMLFGNSSLHERRRARRRRRCPGRRCAFGGPRFGIAGWRSALGAHGRPLTCSALKPQGLPPRDWRARGLSRAPASTSSRTTTASPTSRTAPFAERVRAVQRAVDRSRARPAAAASTRRA